MVRIKKQTIGDLSVLSGMHERRERAVPGLALRAAPSEAEPALTLCYLSLSLPFFGSSSIRHKIIVLCE